MVKQVIYIASTEELSGKSVVTISLALIAKELGKEVGYFKPIGVESALSTKEEILDEDVESMRKILGLKCKANVVCPVMLGKGEFLNDFGKADVSRYADEIIASYKKVSEGKEVMLIEAPPTLSIGSFLGCSVPKLAANFKAKIVLTVRFRDDFVVDEVLEARDYCMKWRVSLFGVILNRIPRNKMERAKDVVKPFLEHNGLRSLGFILEDKVLSSLTVKEIYEFIGGKVLAGKDGMGKMIQKVLIGAMTPESATRYFRKAKHELIITGGDRTDIIFAALEAGTSALILTGNLYPA